MSETKTAALRPYRVTYTDKGVNLQQFFNCQAEDDKHAKEQAESAYPGCSITNIVPTHGNLPYDHWLGRLSEGAEVFVSGFGFAGHVFKVTKIRGNSSATVRRFHDVVKVTNANRGVFSVMAFELTEVTETAPQVSFRLTVDVTYNLNGDAPSDMRAYLDDLIPSAVGDGLLTGTNEATIFDYNWKVTDEVDTDSVDALTKFEADISRFNEMYRLPAANTPTLDIGVPVAQRLRDFKNILAEELNEIDDIIVAVEAAEAAPSELAKAEILTNVADLLGDIQVYCASEMRKFGIPQAKVLDIIMQSNFSKLGADGKTIYDERGKVSKGPSYWKPEPMLREMLVTQIKSHTT